MACLTLLYIYIQVSLDCAARGLPREAVKCILKALRAQFRVQFRSVQFSLAQISQLAKALRAALDLRSAEWTIFSELKNVLTENIVQVSLLICSKCLESLN